MDTPEHWREEAARHRKAAEAFDKAGKRHLAREARLSAAHADGQAARLEAEAKEPHE